MVKIIHFVFNSQEYSCELSDSSKDDDLKEIFRSIALADSNAYLRLYNSNGNLVPISTNLPINDKTTSYRLEVTKRNSIMFDRLFKKIDRTDEHNKVYAKFLGFNVSNELRESIKFPSFNNWKCNYEEMLALVRQMFVDLNLNIIFNINLQVLNEFLFEIYLHYNDIPFHNFKHAFVVTQMIYSLIHLMNLQQLLEPLDILSLLISALCHDLDHDGFNNSYQINALTPLALLYNNKSPLEMYHCAVAFSILTNEKYNILTGLSREQFKRVRENIIECILSTDMTYHKELLFKFESIVDKFDFKKREDVLILLKIVMKTADISNECRPLNVSEAWLDCLLEEFFNQGDQEKLHGLPISPLMDRNSSTKSNSQLGFINYVLLPLVKPLEKLFPQIHDALIVPINKSVNYYQELAKKDS